jgi:uncharacterized protein YhhL (DUF1145 family)
MMLTLRISKDLVFFVFFQVLVNYYHQFDHKAELVYLEYLFSLKESLSKIFHPDTYNARLRIFVFGKTFYGVQGNLVEGQGRNQ